MPWYRMGRSVVHLHMDKRQRKKAPPPCPFFVYVGQQEEGGIVVERVKVRCMCMAPYLCDWPGCNAPFCEDHRLNVGPDLDVCPTHNHKRGLFSRLLPPPTPETDHDGTA